MKIAVTGSSGKVGLSALAALRKAGHRLALFDLKPASDGSRTTILDCTDFGQVAGALSGVDTVGAGFDAVLHLAGIPAPGLAADQAILANNTLATYNVFSSCARLGIRRVVWASSETILGLPFDRPPDFAPLDETHPDRPEWSYSLSKKLGEEMADTFVRWHPALSVASLRFSNVFDAADYAMLARIQGKPEQRRWNLWGYVDARDCAEACRLALEAPLSGHERFLIAAADTIVDVPSAELMQRYFRGVTLRTPLQGCMSLLSSAKAAGRLGYTPRHSWRDQAGK